MLKDKIVVVTGGAGLLGKVFIRSIVENGGIGVIADVNEELWRKATDEVIAAVGKPGASVDHFPMDITSDVSIEAFIRNVAAKYGRIDALVNSAYPRNRNYGRKFEEVTYRDFCENVDLHLGGYFHTSQKFALFFKEQGYGNIVNISSIYGVIAPRFDVYEGTSMTMPVEYSAIKSAVIHLTKYIAKYFKGANIRANCISPGGILAGQPEEFLRKYREYCLNKGLLDNSDITGTLVYLLSDMSKFVNGQNIIVDDGFCQ